MEEQQQQQKSSASSSSWFSHFSSSALRSKTLTSGGGGGGGGGSSSGEGLVRSLGLFDLILLGVGASIGAGIFVVTGTVARDAGPDITSLWQIPREILPMHRKFP